LPRRTAPAPSQSACGSAQPCCPRAPATLPEVADESFSLLNDGDPLRVVLTDAAGGLVDDVSIERAAQGNGVSATRCTDVSGAVFGLHDVLGAGPNSPGRCLNGARYPDGCRF
jgi:hypothetical protein